MLSKKGIKLVLIAIALMLAFALSGCINSDAKPFEWAEGINISPYRDGESYGAQIFIYSTNINYAADGKKADTFFLDCLNSEFEATALTGYPSGRTGESPYAIFGYDIKINEEDWFFKGDPVPDIKEGFFTATASFDYSNPFADCLKNGTKFNRIYNYLKTTDSVNFLSENFGISDISLVEATVVMSGSYTLKTETGGVLFEPDSNYHYYKFSSQLSNAGNERLKYSYSVMQPYGWYTIALIIGIVAVVLTLLIAKKMSGRVVDANRKKAVQPSVTVIFDPFDNGDPPNGSSGNSSGGSGSSGGGIFDGF